MTITRVNRSGHLFSGAVPSFMGLLLPLILGVYSVPYIIDRLGIERFGALTVVWAVAGYFSLFDFGISRAMTQRVAGNADPQACGRIVRSGLTLLLILGVGGMLVIGLVSWVAMSAGVLSASRENIYASLFLGMGIPFLMIGQGLRGILEGLCRFSVPAWGRIINGVMTFGAPIPLLAEHSGIDILVATLSLGRMATMLLQGFACKSELLQAWSTKPLGSDTSQLLRLGGWMTVSSIVSPLMLFVDRIMVSTSIHAQALAYYTTPFEMVTRLLIVPGAIGSAVFPRLSRLHRVADSSAAEAALAGMALTLGIMAPMVVGLQLFSFEILDLWLGPTFAEKGSLPMQLIAWGVFLNGIAQFPFIYLQSAGKPDLIAKVHLIEFLLYILAVPTMLNAWGINGVACAWLVRAAVDLVLIGALSVVGVDRVISVRLVVIVVVSLVTGGISLLFEVPMHGIPDRVLYLLVLTVGCVLISRGLVRTVYGKASY